MPDLIVVGSVNLDMVVETPHVPAAGETVLGGALQLIPGGKGANQAVAAARLGAGVAMIGCVGQDAFAATARSNLDAARVDCRFLTARADTPTGVALITVTPQGENAICVAPGANAMLRPEDVAAAETLFTCAKACLVQLEIPIDTAMFALKLAERHNVRAILDPAPVPAAWPPGLLSVDVVTPNETEAAQLLRGLAQDAPPEQIGSALRGAGARTVVLKRGAAGARIVDGSGEADVAGFPVDVVDTTAAGDTFAAALAVGLSEGMDVVAAVRFANAAGALACTKLGAQTSAPTRAAVEALLRRA